MARHHSSLSGALIPHPALGSAIPRGSEMPQGLHIKLQSEMMSPALPPSPCSPNPSVRTGSRIERAPTAQPCLQKAREKPSRILTVQSTTAQIQVCSCRRESAQVSQPWADGWTDRQRTEGEAKAMPLLPLPNSRAAERGELAETRRDPRQQCTRAGSEPLCFISRSCRERLIHLFRRKRRGNCSSATCQERPEEPGSLRICINYCFLFLSCV